MYYNKIQQKNNKKPKKLSDFEEALPLINKL